MLLDTRFRTFATPRLIAWIYRGCLAGIVVVTVWWVLVAWWMLSWRNGWFWGALLLVAAPIIGVVLLLCVRVACEFAVVRFPQEHADDVPEADVEGRETAGALASGADGAARSVIRTGRAQEGEQVATEHPTDPEEHRVVGEGDERRDEGLSDAPAMRPLWIAGAVGGAVLLVLVALTLIVSASGEDDVEPRSARPGTPVPATPSPSAPASVPPATAPAVPATPSPSPSAVPTAPVERWSGTLTLTGPRTRRDLDAVPPRLSTRDGEPDIRGDWLKPIIEAESGAQVALMTPRTRPGAIECRDAAAASGSDETERLSVGDVVCVATEQGTVARLVITEAEQTSGSPVVAARAVIWSVPGQQP